MRVDSSPRHLPPVQRTERADKAAEPVAPAAGVPATPAPQGKGAEHRSAVATLRQYINHPERYDGPPPEALLTSEVKGNGFQRALEAYRASLPPVVEPPAVEVPVAEVPPVETPPDQTPAVLVPVVEVPEEPVVDPLPAAEPA